MSPPLPPRKILIIHLPTAARKIMVTIIRNCCSPRPLFPDILCKFSFDTGVQLKCYVKSPRRRRCTKRNSVCPIYPGHSSMYVEINEKCIHKISQEDFDETMLTVRIKARHKILARRLSLGKVFIGKKSRDEAGKTHWRIVNGAPPGYAWNMWHPVYSS